MLQQRKQPGDNRAAFIAIAKAAEADTDETRWKAKLRAVVKPPAKSVNSGE